MMAVYVLYSKSLSMVRAPTSLEVDTLTAKATGYVFRKTLCKFDPVM